MTAGASTDPGVRTSETAQPTWRLGAAQAAGAVVAAVLAGAGLVSGRVDLALLALPLIMSCAWAWDRRPARTDVSTFWTEPSGDTGATEVECALTLVAAAGVEAVDLRITTLGGRSRQLRLRPSALRAFVIRAPVVHSGPQDFFKISYRLLGADGAVEAAPIGPLVVRRAIAAPHTAIASLPLPRQLPGVTGSHDSARPGDGGDFRDIHSFTAGDRLRRIDWKVTARRGQYAGDLYVRRTAATADATVFLVIDSRDDVGEHVSEWNANRPAQKGATSLDLAREAASAIAAGYIRAGDRVGFQDLANTNRVVAPGGGSRHLLRVLRSIELTAPSGLRVQRLRPPTVTSGSLVYLLSSLLDDEAGQLATWWTGSGHRVLVVDVLPHPQLGHTTRYDRLAHRIVLMQREDRVRELRALGIEVLRWPGPPAARAAHLRALSRPGRGRR